MRVGGKVDSLGQLQHGKVIVSGGGIIACMIINSFNIHSQMISLSSDGVLVITKKNLGRNNYVSVVG